MRHWLSLSLLLVGYSIPSLSLSISPAITYPLSFEDDSSEPLEIDNNEEVAPEAEKIASEADGEPRKEKSLIGYVGGHHGSHHGSHHNNHHFKPILCYIPDTPVQPQPLPTTPTPGVVLLTEVTFYGSNAWSGTATLIGKKNSNYPDGTTCSFDFDFTARGTTATLASPNDLSGCWKAALRGELQAEGGRIERRKNGSNSDTPPSFLCVDWSSDEEFTYFCDLVQDPSFQDPFVSIHNLECQVSALTTCPP